MIFVREFAPNADEKLIFREHKHWIAFVSHTWLHTLLYVFLTSGLLWLYSIWDASKVKTFGIPLDYIWFINVMFFVIMTIFYLMMLFYYYHS